jgi:hypothetical protein
MKKYCKFGYKILFKGVGLHHCAVYMDYNIDENWPVFTKTVKTGPDRFYQFTENRLAQFFLKI